MNTQQKIRNILDNWEGTRMVEKHFGDGDELINELKALIEKEFGEPLFTPEIIIDQHKTLKELLRIQIYEKDEINWYGLEAYHWPEEDGEAIDLENVRVIFFNEKKLIIVAGGDWQIGCVITIEALNGKLVVTDTQHPETFPEGDLRIEELLK